MTFYRYESTRWESGISLTLYSYPVTKQTPCGVWLELLYGGGKRFVLTSARKRFACPTKEEALESFKARKRRQVRILRARLDEAERALTLMPDGMEDAGRRLFT